MSSFADCPVKLSRSGAPPSLEERFSDDPLPSLGHPDMKWGGGPGSSSSFYQKLQADTWRKVRHLQEALAEADQGGWVWTPLLDQIAHQGFWPDGWALQELDFSEPPVPGIIERAENLVPWLEDLDSPSPAGELLDFESWGFLRVVVQHTPDPDESFTRQVIQRGGPLPKILSSRQDLSDSSAELLYRHATQLLVQSSDPQSARQPDPVVLLDHLCNREQAPPSNYWADLTQELDKAGQQEVLLELADQLDEAFPSSALQKVWGVVDNEQAPRLAKHPSLSTELARKLLEESQGQVLFKVRKVLARSPRFRSDPDVRSNLRASQSPEVLFPLLLEADAGEFLPVFHKIAQSDLAVCVDLAVREWPEQFDHLGQGPKPLDRHKQRKNIWNQARSQMDWLDSEVASRGDLELVARLYNARSGGIPPAPRCETRLAVTEGLSLATLANLCRHTQRNPVFIRSMRKLMVRFPEKLPSLLEGQRLARLDRSSFPLTRLLKAWEDHPESAREFFKALDSHLSINRAQQTFAALESGEKIQIHRQLLAYSHQWLQQLLGKGDRRGGKRLLENMPFLRRLPEVWENPEEGTPGSWGTETWALLARSSRRPQRIMTALKQMSDHNPHRAALVLKRHPSVVARLPSSWLSKLLTHSDPSIRKAVMQASRKRRGGAPSEISSPSTSSRTL